MKTAIKGLSRRGMLGRTAGLVGTAATTSVIGTPLIAQNRSLRIGSYGGYFEDSFRAHVYPAFTEATGIAVESVTQPNSADWLVTMQQATQAGSVPTDLSLFARDSLIRASRIGDLLAPLDVSRIPNAQNLDDYFVFEASDGVLGVGAMSWFTAMVVNSDEVPPPESWAEFWDTDHFEASLGIARRHDAQFLDIVAATFFDGAETLMDRDGILAVVAKAGEIAPNVALWWSAESQMEQALKNLDVIGGQYYHDVSMLMAADGFPVQSVFPREGNPQDYGSWCLAALSDRAEEAAEFINFSSDPATQALMSRMIGTAPLVDKSLTDLTEEEFGAVSGTPAIRPAYDAYIEHGNFIQEAWEQMLAQA